MSWLPLRQKVLIGLSISIGIFICIAYSSGLIDASKLTLFIFVYSFSNTICLLLSETLIDLDDNRIFNIWMAIGLTQFCFYLFSKDNLSFKINRSPNIVTKNFLNNYLSDTSTSSLKTLLIFLIAYKILNSVMKKLTGNCLINSFRQHSWIHDTKNRKISGLDITFNILLFAIAIISALTR